MFNIYFNDILDEFMLLYFSCMTSIISKLLFPIPVS